MLPPERRSVRRVKEAVLFANEGGEVALSAAPGKPLRVLLIAGVPLREPIARYGPFVMNTRAQIIEAFEDFQSGRLGEIA